MRTLLLAALLVTACGSSSTGTAKEAASVGDGGANASSPVEWKSGDHVGLVYVRYDSKGASLSTVAVFYPIPSPAAVCSRTTSGPCAIADCKLPVGADAGGVSAGSESDPAGPITVTGGAIPASYGATYVDDHYKYVETKVTAAPWKVGDPITVAASGEWVAPFSTTLPAPAYGVTVSAPALSEAAPLAVDRAQPLTFAWSGATGGKMNIVVQNSGSEAIENGSYHGVSATCTFDAAAGTATIPAAVMQTMVAGKGTALLYPASDTTLMAGQYQVQVSLQTDGTAGALTFQ